MASPSVKINENAKGFLTILAKNSNKSQQDYLSTAIEFIYGTGLDIYGKKAVNVADSMKSLENRIIGFMKKREKDFFVPMSKRMSTLTQSNMDLIKGLETLDVISLISSGPETAETPKFKIPEGNGTEEKEGIPSNSQRENGGNGKEMNDTLLELESYRTKADLFKEQLEFLVGKINRGSGLNSGKFIANITQRDWDRLNRIINDN